MTVGRRGCRWTPDDTSRSRVRNLSVAVAIGLILLSFGLLAGAGHVRGSNGTRFTSSVLAPAASYPTTGVSPPPTAFAAATFDSADAYVFMFGGTSDADVPEAYSWAFVHNNWTNLTPVIGPGPSPRWGAAMVYDPVDGYVLLFGGCLDAACSIVANDTWSYAHDRWTDLTPGLSVLPPARGEAMMAYDPSDGYVLLFGGLGTGSNFLDDTWAFAGGHWSDLSAGSVAVPSARAGSMVAYDSATTSVVLFGGSDAAARMADTWSYHGGNWTNLTASVGPSPSPRWHGAMTYEAADGYLLLVNGYNSGTYLGDEWTFSGHSWGSINPANAPVATYGSVLVYDSADSYVLFFSGGASNGYLTSTFIYSQGAWTLLINPPGTFPLLDLLAFPLIIVVVVIISLLVGGRLRRRREVALGQGFTVAPGEVVDWIPTGAAGRRIMALRLLPLAFLFVVFLPFLLLVGGAGGLLFALPVLALIFIFVAIGAYALWSQTPREIGVVRAGVIARRKVGELRVAWSQIQPSPNRPNRGLFWFQTIPIGKQQALGGFPTSADQARAIVLSPYAPPWVLSPPFAQALGVPPQRTPPTAAAPASPSAWPTVGYGAPPTAWPTTGYGAPPTAAPPPPPPPTYWPPPPPAPPPPSSAPLRSSYPTTPPPPPPGTVVCTKCGQSNPIDGAVFCKTCGRRLPR